jgi:hypothetical protein
VGDTQQAWEMAHGVWGRAAAQCAAHSSTLHAAAKLGQSLHLCPEIVWVTSSMHRTAACQPHFQPGGNAMMEVVVVACVRCRSGQC